MQRSTTTASSSSDGADDDSIGCLSSAQWSSVLAYLVPYAETSRAIPALVSANPAIRKIAESTPSGLTIGHHNIRIIASGDKRTAKSPAASPARSATSLSAPPRVAPSNSSTQRHITSTYANDHSKLLLLESGKSGLSSPQFSKGSDGFAASSPSRPQPGGGVNRVGLIDGDGLDSSASAHEPYEISLAFTVEDSIHGEHQRSRWWVDRLVAEDGMFLRHVGFRGRGCHTLYVTSVIEGIHAVGGSLLSLEMAAMWFFTIFLEHMAKTTDCLVELEQLSLQECHVFATMEETVGDLLRKLPSLRTLTLHQFDFSLGRAQQILEAASEHPCLRHININDNIFRTNARNVVMANIQSLRQLESLHINHLPADFWTFGDFFAYKTNLRTLQLSYSILGEAALRDLAHCLNVAVMLEELHLNHCGINSASAMECLFPCTRRGGGVNGNSCTTPLVGLGGGWQVDAADGSPLIPTHGSTCFTNSFGHPSVAHIGPATSNASSSQEVSRNNSPAPVALNNNGVPFSVAVPFSAGSSTSTLPPSNANGFGVNPFFCGGTGDAAGPSPVQLLPPFPLGGIGADPLLPSSPYTPSHVTAHWGGEPAYSSHTICATLPHLRVLNLSDNPFGVAGLQQLAAPLSRMESLEQLYLSGCDISGESAGDVIFHALTPVIGGLFVLDVSKNALGDATLKYLCQQQFFHHLSANAAEIFFVDVGASQESMCAIMHELQGGAWLTLLDLSQNTWEKPQQGGCTAHVDPTMVSASMVRHPSSHPGELSEQAAALLGQLLCGVDGAGPPLHQLKLNFCHVPCHVVIDGLVAAQRCRPDGTYSGGQITTLELSTLAFPTCPMEAQSTAQMLIGCIRETLGRHLSRLDLSRNPLGDEVVSDMLLCQCAEMRSSDSGTAGLCLSCGLANVTSLNLRRTNFERLTATVSHTAEVPRGRTTGLISLTELDLSGNTLSRSEFHQLAERVLQWLPMLQRFDVAQNHILRPSPSILTSLPLPLPSSSGVSGEGGHGAPSSEPQSLLNDDEVLRTLRRRRARVLSEFFPSLVLALRHSHTRLKRLKMDANGLNLIALSTGSHGTIYPVTPSAEANVVLGPLTTEDWRANVNSLPAGVTWDSFLLFSLNVSSS